jgi:asparagine synthase (glutamine-hydrolysing)
MCGLVGFISSGLVSHPDELRIRALKMVDAISHRGPDYSDAWADSSFGVALAHRRLSILDLSPAGNQPMVSACSRFVIVYNGEIYNVSDLRRSLECSGLAPTWRGHSDTEVILACIAAWGLEATLSRARGMFALAVWDTASSTMTLARDRIGQKPLYYGHVGADFLFGSELKALRAFPSTGFHIAPDALALMLRFGYIPSPHSIYQGIFKLPPGTLLRVNAHGHFSEPERWWSFTTTVQQGVENRRSLSDSEALDKLEGLLTSAVAEQMVADVPLGALLSGGIDSSTIVALMRARSTHTVRTFTIGFNEGHFDEADHAKEVARHLGTDHTELHVNSKDALDLIPRLPDLYDEPFADSSQIATSLVCALTRQHVTVCLSGDAGDELFAGYNRYLWTSTLWHRLGFMPRWLRLAISGGLCVVPSNAWNGLYSALGSLLPPRFNVSNPGDKLHKLAHILDVSSPEALYQQLVSQWRGDLPLLCISEPSSLSPSLLNWPSSLNFTERMMAVDTLTYLPDDILAKVDRASMASSLEMRVPFLDERVIDFAWSLPFHQKVRHGEGKWLLRQLLYRHVPRQLVDRPKQGFAVPIDHWLRGPLREWAEDLLSISSLSSDEFLDSIPIRAMWQKHLSGINVQHALWNVLMYLAWKRRWS